MHGGIVSWYNAKNDPRLAPAWLKWLVAPMKCWQRYGFTFFEIIPEDEPLERSLHCLIP